MTKKTPILKRSCDSYKQISTSIFKALENALQSRKEEVVQDALKRWIQLQDRLTELADPGLVGGMSLEQKQTLLKIWDQFCEKADCSCTCGTITPPFSTHFYDNHLFFSGRSSESENEIKASNETQYCMTVSTTTGVASDKD